MRARHVLPFLALWLQAPLLAALQDGATAAEVPPEVEVVSVVDADTLHVLRDGRLEKLRLACVDTEEKLAGRAQDLGAGKPETLFGEECAQWAQAFFEDLSENGAAPKVGLVFPGGAEHKDAYGRLLCHVVLPDGTDFNLLLVETGKSPYFNKYGNSELCHAAFVAAQARARAARRGIWDPRTNQPTTAGAPAARRDYGRLVPWWDARAEAIAGFRARAASAPEAHAAADDPAALEAVLAACEGDPECVVELFGTIDRLFDERDGRTTVLFRAPDARRALRARFAKGALSAERRVALEASRAEYRQNYWSVLAHLVRDAERGGFALDGAAARWELAGHEPDLGR